MRGQTLNHPPSCHPLTPSCHHFVTICSPNTFPLNFALHRDSQRAVVGMADVFTSEKRSLVMAAIKGRGNKDTELRLIAIMRVAGITGWRRNSKLPGRPDFVFRAAKLAVFVDGCFWHGCRKHGRNPSSNREYWLPKLERNQRRDREVTRALKRRGWTVLRLWEHSLKDPGAVARRLLLRIAGSRPEG